MKLSQTVASLVHGANKVSSTLHFATRKLIESIRVFGVQKTASRIIQFGRSGRLWSLFSKRRGFLLSSTADKNNLSSFYPASESQSACDFMTQRVLIVAEMSIPQCKKYRIDQKSELLNSLGVETTIVDWTHFEEVRAHLQTFPIVLFYRVPAVPEIIQLIQECKRLGVHTLWEVDDLIFDHDGYGSNKNLDSLDPRMRNNLLAGMKLYRDALLLCDGSIASTRVLAQVMTEITARPAHIIENALDTETLRLARTIRDTNRSRAKLHNEIVIVYGSGTKTHDIDFQSASQAIYNVLSQRSNVRLRLIGELNIESWFDKFSDRIERLPFTSFDSYLAQVAGADISIAPLEPSIFNDAKSNIKFLEASILGLPSVCSPADAFNLAIVDGDTAFLASNPAEWERALLTLIDNQELRTAMAHRAFDFVTQAYSPENIANKQVAPLLSKFAKPKPNVTRILLANVYFAPQSYGGATIVAEEIAKRLAAKDDVEVYVFTTWSNESAPDYGLVRYNAKGSTVFALKIPTVRTRIMDVKDEKVDLAFKEILAAIKPDIVQLHSIQNLGVGLGSACRAFGIPYTITLHDAWWLCERQFMVTGEEKFCGQEWIDPAVCADCVQDRHFNRDRTKIVRSELLEANGIISPSKYFKNLHIKNGLRDDQIFVNKNGIRTPPDNYRSTPSSRLRFGYVGGSTPIKGYDLVQRAFSELPECEIELVLVDNTLNQGYSTVNTHNLKARNSVRVVPAYTQETIDEFFSHIDVLLFPSQWKESFGLTVREALARDVWVIVTDAGGAIEDIIAGENGEIIPISSDSTYLRTAMENVIRNREYLKNYSNPHKDIIQNFDGQTEELFAYLKTF